MGKVASVSRRLVGSIPRRAVLSGHERTRTRHAEKTDELHPPGYGGITESRDYAANYLGRKINPGQKNSDGVPKDSASHTRLVEFTLPGNDFKDKLKAAGVNPKPELKTMSYGMGGPA